MVIVAVRESSIPTSEAAEGGHIGVAFDAPPRICVLEFPRITVNEDYLN